MRAFAYPSAFIAGNLALALAPALTPAGIAPRPEFFRGFAVYPQTLARGLLVLADITATRYFNYTPVAQRDPVLSAQGDRLRAEVFSACNGVYARLDLLGTGFDGQIAFGTTNVDIGLQLRTALTQIKQQDKLRLDVGGDGLTVSPFTKVDETMIRLEEQVHERPVQMPDRWVRALGNAAEIQHGMEPVFTLKGAQAQAFVASLPPATGKHQSGWLTPSPTGAKLLPRRTPGAVYVSGPHRLSALKRVMTQVSALTFYMPPDTEPGPFMIEAELPGARLTLSLTAAAWQGYSGEGALLASLARPEVLEDAEAIGSMLRFDAAVDAARLAGRWSMSKDRSQAALALLAVSGKLGFDAHENAWFHRELPDDPDRVLKDNPRLVAAGKLLDAVTSAGENQWIVHSNGADYAVSYDPAQDAQTAKCTCTWYLNHQNRHGPCKHILAVQLREGKS
ncbi:MAG: SWIM zinc finger domain-containing protein [Oscillospiraceae bacterium]|jgi:hypothetical protein|nr:SWIM zinc finger domain-containing protein [Oscillospiraceae bacterium]